MVADLQANIDGLSYGQAIKAEKFNWREDSTLEDDQVDILLLELRKFQSHCIALGNELQIGSKSPTQAIEFKDKIATDPNQF